MYLHENVIVQQLYGTWTVLSLPACALRSISYSNFAWIGLQAE
jgi:hypothetical protein